MSLGGRGGRREEEEEGEEYWEYGKSEPLICPAASKRHDGGAGYKSLADNLLAFNELGEVVGVNIEGLDEGEGIERTLTTRQAKWHKSCRVRYDNLKLQPAQKRKESSGQAAGSGTTASSTKRTRSNTTWFRHFSKLNKAYQI
ncbi:hypothetical protein Hamer_G024624 [Homarus americanus]|uniref:Uncharacterized protein n=1 Tax=Homarus americanus TaxID=6706 RepID=A0A8J5JDT1_HOMAM|nr:hypothetical protein Hamer_G024624 [Homarus americanus]